MTGLSTPAFGVCGGWGGASGTGTSEKSSWATALIVKESAHIMEYISATVINVVEPL